MKKIMAATLMLPILMSCGWANAQIWGESDSPFASFYGGIGVGLTTGQSPYTTNRHADYDFAYENWNPMDGDRTDWGFTESEPEGRAFFGYRGLLPDNRLSLRLGLEAYYQFTDGVGALRYRPDRLIAYRVKRDGPEWGVSLIPGIEISPGFLLFSRVGYSRSSFFGTSGEDARTRNRRLMVFLPDGTTRTVPNDNEIFSKSEDLNALHAGFGVETILTDNLSFRMDYIYNRYEELSIPDIGLVRGNNWDPRGSISIEPTPELFMANLIYTLGGDGTEPAHTSPSIDNGLYLSVGGARKVGTFESHRTTRIDMRPFGLAGGEVDVAAGWGLKWGPLYFGAEVSYAPLTDLDFDRTQGFNTHVTMKNAFHAAPRFGILLRPDTMLYAKYGYATTDMKYERTRDVITPEGQERRDSSSTTTDFGGAERRGETRLEGVLWALGLENQIGEGTFLRTEYNYVKYDNWEELFPGRSFRANEHQRMLLYLGYRF